MRQSKLIQLLRTLSSEDLLRLANHVTSMETVPSREALQRLLEYLRSTHPDFSAGEVQKEVLFSRAFPEQPFNQQQLWALCSQLNRLTEDFLAQQRLHSHPVHAQLAKLDILSERHLDKSYRYQLKQTASILADSELRVTDQWRYELDLSELRERHFGRQRLRQFDPYVQESAQMLDRYYYLKRLQQACAMLDLQTKLQGQYEIGLSPAWFEHLEACHYFEEPLIRVYATFYQALLAQDQVPYASLKEQIHALDNHSPHPELRDLYLLVINYCARRIRAGDIQFLAEALQYYLKGIESGMLLEEGQISPWTFANVVKLHLRLSHYDQCEQFIKSQADKLPVAFRENAVNYNLAELYYYTRRFDQAQHHLIQVAYNDLNYYLGARVMLAKIYFEQGAEDPLLDLLSAFTIFLKRNKAVSQDLKQTYLNFCHLLVRILRHNLRKWEKLGEDIQTLRPLTDREWLRKAWEGYE